MTLATGEFIRRFLIHVLPSGFHRIRHYGLFASSKRAENIARATSTARRPGSAKQEPADAVSTEPTNALASMPVLRRPHDRHRDLRARLLSAHASRQRDQNRHIMTIIATSQHRNARRPCRSSTGYSAACSDRQCRPQWKALSADQRTAVRPRRPAQPPHRRRSPRAIDLPQLKHRARGAQIPIAPAVPPHVPPARFPCMGLFLSRSLALRHVFFLFVGFFVLSESPFLCSDPLRLRRLRAGSVKVG